MKNSKKIISVHNKAYKNEHQTNSKYADKKKIYYYKYRMNRYKFNWLTRVDLKKERIGKENEYLRLQEEVQLRV